MRENRPYGSEGGEGESPSRPLFPVRVEPRRHIYEQVQHTARPAGHDADVEDFLGPDAHGRWRSIAASKTPALRASALRPGTQEAGIAHIRRGSKSAPCCL